ncbi:MAG: DUF362 domain-containing protein, partial [Calditrichaeota bacterium]
PRAMIFFIISVFSTIWFLIRVIPKPSRAAYPCMRIAAPMMSSLFIWVASLFTTAFTVKKAKSQFVGNHYFKAGLLSIAAVLTAFLFFTSLPDDSRANLEIWFNSNQPIGDATGIHPGRVVWVHDPQVAQWDGKTGFWWEDQYTSQAASDKMVSTALLSLTGQEREEKAWDALFTDFNAGKKGKKQTFQPHEKIAVKINQNNTSGHENTNEINTSPQLVLSLLKSLIEKAQVPQQNITVFDASRYITDNVYLKCIAVFPDVRFVDHSGNDGRIKSTYVENAIPYSADNGLLARGLAACAVEADYLINMAILKGHVGQGVTLCAKNYYGVTSIDPDWRRNAHDNFNQNRDGSPRYMTFTDFMGHKDLGGKTILFILDAYYGNKFVNGFPGFKWQMAPFDNHWPSSLFMSQDGVAIDAVGMDFIINEFPDAPDMPFCDSYLKECALADQPPSGTVYDPEQDGTKLKSLGVFEHWNNAQDKQYSLNLNPAASGIELVRIQD